MPLSATKPLQPDELVVIGLGSNLAGDYASSEALLESALLAVSGLSVDIVARSVWWRSIAWPRPDEPPFVNGVALAEPSWPADDILERLLEVERTFGRMRGHTNGPRTLDLDLVAYGRAMFSRPGLQIPHPRAHERKFVMGPLAEIAPQWRHPASGRTARELAMRARIGRDARPIRLCGVAQNHPERYL